MDYRVIYQLPNGRQLEVDVQAVSDAQAYGVALTALPANAALVDVDLFEAA